MRDPHELYELTGELPELDRPVLVQALTGFVDAGGAVRLAGEHLLESLQARPIVTFDIDQLLDYRSRRPSMVLMEDHWESYDEPELRLHLLHDQAGTPFLLLRGLEPDLHWGRFTAAMRGLIDRLGVRLTLGLNSIPMAVPHTRPTGIIAHATNPELITGYQPRVPRVQVPGSVANLLEFQLGREGRDAAGFAAQVPHYVAQLDYPAAAGSLLAAVSEAAGLLLPAEALRSAAEETRREIDEQIASSDEGGTLVRALEQQYDTFARGQERGRGLLAGDGSLPTADELAAELEQFLSAQRQRGESPDA